MATFKVLETQFQMFIKSRMYMDDEYVVMTLDWMKRAKHKQEYNSWVNERQMQTTEDKVDSSKALDASLVDTESSGTALKEQDTGEDQGMLSHITKPQLMVAKPIPRIIPKVRNWWKLTGKIFKAVGLRWVPTRKIFNSSTTKVVSEPKRFKRRILTILNGKQTLMSVAGTLTYIAAMTSDHNSSELGIHDHSNKLSSLKLVPKVVPPADKTATS
ncbi:hypothetical protein Tco_0702384 [Tanacetum coccineum]|uniref:Uncharacterized protein n=1 Tax=Tanacetum coccineum TaxID=301880 RepID=A0ABQ4XXR6_9ASTR